MSKDRNSKFENQPGSAAGITPANDKELDSVSGGFTIIDTCQSRWIPGICNAIWGRCPHLSMTQTAKTNSKINRYTYFTVSCSKGCFSNEEYKRDDSY